MIKNDTLFIMFVDRIHRVGNMATGKEKKIWGDAL